MSNPDPTPVDPAVTATAEVKVKKPRFAKLRSKLPSWRALGTGTALVAAGVGGTLLVQKKTGSTLDFEITTPEIDYDDAPPVTVANDS